MNYLLSRYGKIIRFLVSGGSAAATNLGVLYVCTSVFHTYYVWSSVIAFAVSFFVSFTMQKFWTFSDCSVQMLRSQMIKYLLFTVVNLGVNTLMMYELVEYAHFHYLYAQLVTMISIAFVSFFVYHFLIFKPMASLPSRVEVSS